MSYIETAAKYDKIVENGCMKKVTERFLVDADSCIEAERRTVEELTPFISGEFEVTANKKVNIAEVFAVADAERYYLAKVAIVTLDERSAKEKRIIAQWFIGADNFSEAYAILKDEIAKSMVDIEIQSLAETSIKDYFPARQ